MVCDPFGDGWNSSDVFGQRRVARRGLLRAGKLAGLALGSAYLASCGAASLAPARGMVASTRTVPSLAQNVAQVSRTAQGGSSSVVPTGLGVNLHFASTAQALAQIARLAALGVRVVRLDFTWSLVERQRGRYDFAGYEPVINALSAGGIRPLCVLGYSNSLYETLPAPPAMVIGPHTDEVRQAFARFAAAAAAHFKGRGIIWEIWNEPDNVRFWSPVPSPSGYMALVHATVPALRRADPGALLCGPGLAGFAPQFPTSWAFLENCFSLGLPGLIDAISVHPYRRNEPESVGTDFQRLHTLLARYASRNKANMPLLCSEWGYSGTWVTRDQQAAYLTRLSLINIQNGLPISVWYDWQDDGNDPRQQEDNFGLLTWNGQPKPAYAAAQTLVRELNNLRFSRRLTSGIDYGLLFANGAATTQVLWTTGNAHLVTLSLNVPLVTITSMTGSRRTQPVIEGKTVLQINGDPQYLTPGV